MLQYSVAKKLSKRAILLRLVEPPALNKRVFFAREMKMLNSLESRYSLEFLSILNISNKFDSLAYLISPKLKRKLDEKFRAFNFKPYEHEEILIGEEKVGEDVCVKKNVKSVKDFLNGS